MKIQRRLEQLERRLPKPDPDTVYRPRTDEDWLQLYEALGKQGYFAKEPDFPKALASYRQIVQERAQRAQGLCPMQTRHLPGSQIGREEVNAAWYWLTEMHNRVHNGIPPVTEIEFTELVAWFESNHERLYQLCLPSQLLELGNGRITSFGNVRHALRQGPRALRTGEVAQDVRLLRARYSLQLSGQPGTQIGGDRSR